MSTFQWSVSVCLLLAFSILPQIDLKEPHPFNNGANLELQTQDSQSKDASSSHAMSAGVMGRVVRADTGEPVERALAHLSWLGVGSGELSQRTDPDGRFVFERVEPGEYELLICRTGFVCQMFGGESVKAGQNLDTRDIKLTPSLEVISAKDDAFDAVYADQRVHMGFGPTSFSANGKLFAFSVGGMTTGDPVDVWSYDLEAGSLTLIAQTEEEKKQHWSILDLAWGKEGTLYIHAENRVGPARPAFLAATSAGAKVIGAFPGDVGIGPTALFDVSSERLCRGYAFTLTARRRDGTDSFEIAEITRNFVYDAEDSLVLYPEGGIVEFDLNTRRSRKIAVPIEPLILLDYIKTGNSLMVAYVTRGACEPEPSAHGEEEWVKINLSRNVALRRQPTVSHICFVKVR
ncbi:MAG TPA: carboxypeptidase regulatory-like domain-containing protein [Candidatus Acidoferrum sp.]|nr:carboxypeptidase regulatory-like domain-containing protein [Candidatus Acidoferrum sp.]